MVRKKILVGLLVFLLLLNINTFSNASFAAESLPFQNGIVLNIPTLSLTLYKNGEAVKTYPIAVGKPSSQTPLGNYRILYKAKYPSWRALDGSGIVPPGPNNPLGTRWINFKTGYGIHGTNNPKSIGTFASHGCVRMHNKDVEELYEMVYIGMPVSVTYNTIAVSSEQITGQPILTIYPDIYRRGVNTIAKVKAVLGELGFRKFPSDAEIAALINKNGDKAVMLSGISDINVNGHSISKETRFYQGHLYIPVRAVGEALGRQIGWDQADRMVLVDNMPVQTIILEGNSYLPIEKIKEVFGCEAKWDTTFGCLNLSASALFTPPDQEQQTEANLPGSSLDDSSTPPMALPYVTLNGENLTDNLKWRDGRCYLPMFTLAEALKLSYCWSESGQKLLLNGIPITGFYEDTEFYVSVEEFCGAAGLYYIWNADTGEMRLLKD